MLPTTTVVFADTQPAMHDAYSTLASTHQGLQVVATVYSAEQLYQQVQQHQPQVVVTEIMLGAVTGPELMQNIMALSPHTMVIVYTQVASRLQVEDMADVGIHGYVLKSEPLSKLVETIKEVQKGRPYNTPEVQAIMRHQRLEGGLRDHLPPKTFTILRLKFDAHVHIAIGDQMSLSPKTVDTYTGNVTKVFQLQPSGLTKFCVKNGIVGIEWDWKGR